ncbi:NrdA-like ribonucleotide reductase alpha subunit [Klebsiella phage Muenster]|nr:NrdA-like ribonucleotide reductase alpha subunit [Klebsiella phage Muenster]
MINVIKRDGSKEPLDLDKIHQILFFACEGISGVSVSEIEIRAKLQFHEGIKTSVIHDILIKSSSELISEDTPNYQYVAGRLLNYSIRKEVYGQYEPIPYGEYVNNMVQKGIYDPIILEKYNSAEIEELGKCIKHKRDDKFTFVAMSQWQGKYLCKNRVTKEIYETPQMAYMTIAATIFSEYSTEIRLSYVKKFYDAISTFDISLPTPIMSGLRTNTRQFSSCVVLNVGDSLDSIGSSNHAILRYISRKAGLGVNMGRIRAIDSAIRDGDAVHTGVVPFLSALAKTVKSCSQGGVRGGAATVHFPMWHLEFENIVVLKNNKGTEFNRVRQLDYCFQINKTLYQRLIDGKDITFFSPHDVPDLYDAFCADQEEFERLYIKYELDETIRRKTMPAIEAFSHLIQERAETGRIYIQNIDNANEHGSFIPEIAPIEQSNLCQEIDLPSVPFEDINNGEGLISLCTLSAINWGNFDKPEDMEEACDLAVRALDAILDYQDYPVLHAERATKLYRPLGVGIMSLAYFLAKRGLKYDTNALSTINEWSEAWSYYLIKASVNLAKEKGHCDGFKNTKYSLGLFPHDTYKSDSYINEIAPYELKQDWDSLREEMMVYGIRNATLHANMPGETSSQISNSTAGIEKIRSLVTVKTSKDGVLKQVVPEISKLKNKYDLLWEQSDNIGYLQVCGVMQKYMDQGISTNTSYNPEKFQDGKVPMSVLLTELLMAYKLNTKQLYYHNVLDNASEVDIDKYMEEKNKLTKNDIVLLELPEDDCESCKL